MSIIEPDFMSLKELGLTENQSKCIIGMVKIGSQSDATTIAKVSNIPRSKIYLILQQLNELELIETFQIEGGNNYYKCLKIDDIISRLKDISAERINRINQALESAENTLKSLENIDQSENSEILDFVAIKGRDRIIQQIIDLIDQFHEPPVRILINLPFFTYKGVSIAVLDELLKISKNSKIKMNLDILVNEEEYNAIKKTYGADVLTGYFLAIKFPPKANNSTQIPIKLPITSPSSNIFINLENLFDSRPFFLIVDNESAFIIIENDYTSTALRIQNKTFLQFQMDIINSLFAVVKQFGHNNFIVNS